jgi:uncharacterized protein (TIGR01777 family)
MKILVTGATGFVGSRLCERLRQRGDTVAALSRNGVSACRRVPALEQAYTWDPLAEPAPGEALAGVDGIIHLLGEPVAGRWTEAKKRLIFDSRVVGTRNLVEAISTLDAKPKVLISSSAMGYYGDRGEEQLTEESSAGEGFTSEVCQAWEQEALRVEPLGVRLVRLRTGLVLAKAGGPLAEMLTPFRLGAGGPLGSGRQWWSWIHRDDAVGLIIHLLDSDYHGASNGTTPEPVRQKEFARILGRVLHRPAFMPAPAFVLKAVLGGFSFELLASRRVLPNVAQRIGYRFQYPDLNSCLQAELGG